VTAPARQPLPHGDVGGMDPGAAATVPLEYPAALPAEAGCAVDEPVERLLLLRDSDQRVRARAAVRQPVGSGDGRKPDLRCVASTSRAG